MSDTATATELGREGDAMNFIGPIEVHPAADLFPEMDKDRFDALCKSVKRHGIRSKVVFHSGKLLDGRNRLRAWVLLGHPSKDIPKTNLPPDVDPFQYAWDANCERLDYTPMQKAAIRINVDEASGALWKAREEAVAKANKSRAAKAEAQHAVSNPRAGETVSGERSGDRSPDPRPSGEAAVDRHVAEAAKVSVSTAKRARKLKETDPKTFDQIAKTGKIPKRKRHGPRPGTRKKNWSVPRGISAMAAFLRKWLTTAERLKLARLLIDK